MRGRQKTSPMENHTNCNGKLHVQFHDYPGGRVDTLTHAIERGLLIRYKPNIVLLQIGGNDCILRSFDDEQFEKQVDKLILAYIDRDVMVLFMSILTRSNPRYCTPEEYTTRRKSANAILKKKG